MDNQSDTKKHNTRDMELDLLAKIHDTLVELTNRIESVEKRMDVLIQDMNTIHKFQQSFAERLSIVERFCVDRPLQSTRVMNEPPDNGGNI